MNKQFVIAVISTREFDRLVAEVRFPEKDLGLIVSQEEENGPFEVSLFSFRAGSKDAFEEGEYHPETSIKLETLLQAIAEAKERLNLMDEPRDI